MAENQVQAAFARAASRGGPLFRPFIAYRAAGVTDDLGRPLPQVLDFWFRAPGALRWRDTDRTDVGGADLYNGEGVLTLFLDWPGPTPDMIRQEDGSWLLVTSAMDADALRASCRIAVRRWTGAEPEIYGPNWVQPVTPSRAGHQW